MVVANNIFLCNELLKETDNSVAWGQLQVLLFVFASIQVLGVCVAVQLFSYNYTIFPIILYDYSIMISKDYSSLCGELIL
jgi:hypothetical protein